MRGYQTLIAEHAEGRDLRHVEAWMRLDYPFLNGLSTDEFRRAVIVARHSVDIAAPGQSERLAEQLGIL